jgi:hypothetical protein
MTLVLKEKMVFMLEERMALVVMKERMFLIV